jgi:hypothetical protein
LGLPITLAVAHGYGSVSPCCMDPYVCFVVCFVMMSFLPYGTVSILCWLFCICLECQIPPHFLVYALLFTFVHTLEVNKDVHMPPIRNTLYIYYVSNVHIYIYLHNHLQTFTGFMPIHAHNHFSRGKPKFEVEVYTLRL